MKVAEDETLCRAYISVSVDYVQGTNQTAERLWEVVASKYHEQPEILIKKTLASLQSRFQVISTLVMYFVAQLSHAMTNNGSGTNKIDWVISYFLFNYDFL